jgi:uncharacterized delta-60 repeat protein
MKSNLTLHLPKAVGSAFLKQKWFLKSLMIFWIGLAVGCSKDNGFQTIAEADQPSITGQSVSVKCQDDQHLETSASGQQVCAYNTKSCAIENGFGRQTWDGTQYSNCGIRSCNIGFHTEGNNCASDVKACAASNGTGNATWTGNTYGPCLATACSSGFHLEANACVSNSRSCPIMNGAGSQVWNGTAFGSCMLNTCNTDYHVENNSCLPNVRSCVISSGSGQQIWNGSTYGACQATGCMDGNHMENNACLPNTKTCMIENGNGSQTWNGTSYGMCAVTTCNASFHKENNQCLSNSKSCPIVNGTGTQAWTGSGYGACVIMACDPKFHTESNQCLADVKACPMQNGMGTQTWNGTGYGTCSLSTCNANYHIENAMCITDIKACVVQNGQATQVWNGTAYGSCTVSSCNVGYYNQGNQCLNSPPVAVEDASTQMQGVEEVIDVLANDTDPSSEPLTIASVSQIPVSLNVQIIQNSSKLSVKANAVGSFQFSYTVKDSSNNVSTSLVKLTVTPFLRITELKGNGLYLSNLLVHGSRAIASYVKSTTPYFEYLNVFYKYTNKEWIEDFRCLAGCPQSEARVLYKDWAVLHGDGKLYFYKVGRSGWTLAQTYQLPGEPQQMLSLSQMKMSDGFLAFTRETTVAGCTGCRPPKVFILKYQGGVWSEDAVLSKEDPMGSDTVFGQNLKILDQTVFVGDLYNKLDPANGWTNPQKRVFIYKRINGVWANTSTFDTGPIADTEFASENFVLSRYHRSAIGSWPSSDDTIVYGFDGANWSQNLTTIDLRGPLYLQGNRVISAFEFQSQGRLSFYDINSTSFLLKNVLTFPGHDPLKVQPDSLVTDLDTFVAEQYDHPTTHARQNPLVYMTKQFFTPAIADALDLQFGDKVPATGQSTGTILANARVGSFINAKAIAVVTDSQDRILVAGHVSQNSQINLAIWRFKKDGSIDTSFGEAGIRILDFSSRGVGRPDEFAVDLKLDPSQNIIVLARADNLTAAMNSDCVIVKLTSEGALDTSFGDLNPSGGLMGATFKRASMMPASYLGSSIYAYEPRKLLIESSGKILVLGRFFHPNQASYSDMTVCRFLTDGNIDQSYAWNGCMTSGSKYPVDFAFNSSGELFALDSSGELFKMRPEGGSDSSFSPIQINRSQIGASFYLTNMQIDSAGRFVVIGHGLSNSSQATVALFRYLKSGAVDESFGLLMADKFSRSGVLKVEFPKETGQSYLGINQSDFAMGSDGSLYVSFNMPQTFNVGFDNGLGVEFTRYMKLTNSGELDSNFQTRVNTSLGSDLAGFHHEKYRTQKLLMTSAGLLSIGQSQENQFQASLLKQETVNSQTSGSSSGNIYSSTIDVFNNINPNELPWSNK